MEKTYKIHEQLINKELKAPIITLTIYLINWYLSIGIIKSE